MSKATVDQIWEHREVRFDIMVSQLKMRSGEKLIDTLESIEDTKGNAGDRGKLMVTNLRVMWQSKSMPRVSLSLGHSCVLNITTKFVNSKLRGVTEALYILTKCNHTRFEFIFTNLVPGNHRLFTSVIGVYKAYNSSKIYRELKLRCVILEDGHLKLAPLEHIVNTVTGTWNLSSDQGNLGTLIVTNVRVVWYANMNENYNISIPFLQIASVKLRDSKFGVALVIESSETSGGYVLGFRVDPKEKLDAVYTEISKLHSVFSDSPIFGVEYTHSDIRRPTKVEQNSNIRKEIDEIEEIDESHVDNKDAFAVYLADGEIGRHVEPREPVFCSELGLAVEKLKDGFTIDDLWRVIPQDKKFHRGV
ncbi:BBSome complex member BBS5 [Lepeophtheirus salmonis]|uniref:BBSome complex member BBS5 PH domain-containing protein n=2 Tax=Lepeophtheirus salmonis TaxID=72036 RepID=A0A0K2TEW1_LEPSM|nr:Bardet-Biedl syndrome 5 protein homolog [Lepeophtheirus salmonis]